MTKKLVGLLFVALFCVAITNAATLNCSQTSAGTGNPATFAAGGTGATFSGVQFTCSAPSVPLGSQLTSVTLTINQSFSQAIQGQTNTIDFSYTFSAFGTMASLTTSSSSNPTSGDNGGATDLGGIVGQTPAGACAVGGNPLVVNCTEPGGLPLSTTSFSITGASSWITGGLGNGGADGFGVSATYTYAPIVSTPEPASLMMIGGGLVGLALVARRRRKV